MIRRTMSRSCSAWPSGRRGDGTGCVCGTSASAAASSAASSPDAGLALLPGSFQPCCAARAVASMVVSTSTITPPRYDMSICEERAREHATNAGNQAGVAGKRTS